MRPTRATTDFFKRQKKDNAVLVLTGLASVLGHFPVPGPVAQSPVFPRLARRRVPPLSHPVGPEHEP